MVVALCIKFRAFANERQAAVRAITLALDEGGTKCFDTKTQTKTAA